MPARDDDGMAGPVAENGARQPGLGGQRALQHPAHHRGAHVGGVDDVQNGVVPVHRVGLPSSPARTEALRPSSQSDATTAVTPGGAGT